MDFFEFLLSFIPHRWLDKKKTGVKRLFGGIANILEWTDKYRQIIVSNSSARTTVELLPDLESEYGLTVNPNMTDEVRRQRIIAKKRERGSIVQEEDLLSLISAYGLSASVERPQNCMLAVNIIISQRSTEGLLDILTELLENNIRAHIMLTCKIILEQKPLNIYLGTALQTGAELRIYPIFHDALTASYTYPLLSYYKQGTYLSVYPRLEVK